ncbi:MAG TPA: hypothetical protein PK230_09315, partial [Chitinophagales bacterium]|nr:hypothetical protein [Chitinophagales bacterium]
RIPNALRHSNKNIVIFLCQKQISSNKIDKIEHYHKIKQRPQHAGRIHSKKEHPFLLLFG